MNQPTPIRHLPEIHQHIRTHFSDDSYVLHEKTSSTIHVDIHAVRPNSQRPYFTLLTSGMSDLDMTAPPHFEDVALAEACLCLPSDWPLSIDGSDWRKPEYAWPISLLHKIARYPHQQKTWLYWGHSLGDLDDPLSFGIETDFAGVVLIPPQTFPAAAVSVNTNDGRVINYLAVVPIHRSEMKFRSEQGYKALAKTLFAAGVDERLRPDRPSVL